MKQRSFFRNLAAGAALALIATVSMAQGYPSKSVRMMVPFAPGSATDALGRIIGAKLSEMWGQAVVIENRAGAGGTILTDIVAKSTPDGHTLIVVSAAHAVNATLYPKLPYDTLKDFAGVTLVASIPNVLIVRNELPVKTLRDLIDLAKSQPGKLNYGSAGIGAASHLNGELFKSMAGVDIVHIPFKGFSDQMTEILGGRLDMTWGPIILAIKSVQAGRVRPLAVSTGIRSSSLQEVPTAAEAGVPGMVFDPWFAILAPAATPRGVIGKLNGDIIKVMQEANQVVPPQLQQLAATAHGGAPSE